MNVIGYIISYESGLEIKSFCKKNGLNLLEIMAEPEESRPDYRPKLVQLMNEAPRKKFTGVVVSSFSELAQEEDIRKWIIDELKKYSIEVYSATETVLTKPENEVTAKSKSIKLKARDLPSLPEVVTKITELVQNPKSSAAELSIVISQDSGLTSRVLRLVNSAYYGFPKQISSIQHAIMILGFSTI